MLTKNILFITIAIIAIAQVQSVGDGNWTSCFGEFELVCPNLFEKGA